MEALNGRRRLAAPSSSFKQGRWIFRSRQTPRNADEAGFRSLARDPSSAQRTRKGPPWTGEGLPYCEPPVGIEPTTYALRVWREESRDVRRRCLSWVDAFPRGSDSGAVQPCSEPLLAAVLARGRRRYGIGSALRHPGFRQPQRRATTVLGRGARSRRSAQPQTGRVARSSATGTEDARNHRRDHNPREG